ncbi:MAG TPA: SDR family oxidoreductase [Usitatibacter sp.]|nr:SDR family oxidoreductase [Usitatibacter sp.]
MAKRGIVVVSGASAGIGRATARRFARAGWRVAVLARGSDGLEAACREIEAAGAEAMAIALDVADETAVEAAADRVEREWGPIDAWINNAMVTAYCEFMDMSPQDFRRATEVTYFGSVWGIRAALKRMLARDRGAVVQVGSALAYRSIPLQSAYCGAKSALRGFIDSLRSELLHRGSRVKLTMVQLSAFNTPQFDWGKTCIPKQPQPLPPIFQPEVAAEGIYYAATHPRRELWVGWPAVKAILAQRFIPGILDRILARQGYDGQHTNDPLPPGRRDNLYEPVPGDHGAHGRFDSRSKPHSVQLWLNVHRTLLLAGAALLAGIGGGMAMRRRLR